MKIRIKQIRKLEDETFGTDITLGKGEDATVLQFRPLDDKKPDRDHVCDVEDPAHVARLLAIREGFEVHPSELKTAEGKAAVKRVEEAALKARQEAGVATAVEGLTDDELKAELERRAASKTKTVGGVADENETGDAAVDKMSRDELFAALKEAGQNPNPSTSTKKLRELLEAARKK